MEGVITSLYSQRVNPVLNNLEFHDGIDIYNEVGTDVVSVAKGVVTEVRYSETYGNLLKYQVQNWNNSKKIEIMYAHLDKILVEEGDILKEGDIVAKSGETGLATGPHLHYSIFVDDKAINPLSFLHLELTEEAKNKLLER